MWANAFSREAAAIYLEEGRLKELMEMFQASSPYLPTLDEYASVLSRHYPEDYRLLYDLALRQAMDTANGRKDYRRLIPYLKKIEKLDGEAAAREIAADWKELYPRRRALMEELTRAGW